MARSWTDDELGASVEAYLSMQEDEQAGRPFNKPEIYRALGARFPGSEKSFELWMQKISLVLAQNGNDWLADLTPATNVGTAVAGKIVANLNRLRFERAAKANLVRPARVFGRTKNGLLLWPFSAGCGPEEIGWTEEDDVEFQRLSRGGEPKSQTDCIPVGALKPNTRDGMVRTYVRDQAVIAWVLREANGICDCCRIAAPFADEDGNPFLEVHHMRQLSHGGSDTVSNTVALCPNCHRRLHLGCDAGSLYEQLFQSVPRLKVESGNDP